MWECGPALAGPPEKIGAGKEPACRERRLFFMLL